MSDNSQNNPNQSSPPSSGPQSPVAAQPQQEIAAHAPSEDPAQPQQAIAAPAPSEDPAQSAQSKSNPEKIEILLKPVGDAPILKQKKWKLDAQQSVGYVINWVRRYLKMERDESLFFYVNQAFAPAPDQTLKNLYECFGAEGKLVLHYSKIQAWG